MPEIRKTGAYSRIPKSYPEALRLYADEVEQKELMQKQRDEAIRTKAWISDKKTATAMNTASQKSKEAEKLDSISNVFVLQLFKNLLNSLTFYCATLFVQKL